MARIVGSFETLDDFSVATVDTGGGIVLSGAEMSGPKIHGTNAADTLYGTSGAESIFGYGGNDTLKGFGGADHLDGGSGIDTAFYGDSTVGVAVNLATGRGYGGSAEGDTFVSVENVYGSYHNDTLTGNDGNNELYGLNGNDILKGGGGDDGLAGGDGDDILKGGGGSDYLDGGAGIDTADYSMASTHVIADLRPPGSNSGISNGDSSFDTFVGVENLTGSAFGDGLWGNDGANALRGLDGNDWLRGFGGNDTLDGGNGADSLDGGTGADSMRGGLGDDYYVVDDAGDVIVEYAGEGDERVESSISYTLGANLEQLFLSGNGAINGTGNELVNYIGGNTGDNVLDGAGGADRMAGSYGNDTYFVDNVGDWVWEYGGQGTDVVRTSVSYTLTAGADIELLATMSNSGTAAIDLTGNANGNVVRGNDGNNVINGGDGRDDLIGLGGQDSFLFDTALNAATNVDRVIDFNVADDTILLDRDIFSSSLGLGNISAGEFVIGTAAQDANDRIIYDSNSGALFYDNDGVGGNAATQFAQLSTGLALTNLDFLVVA
jgi:Ca2+-binding RTX toxin-like protein